MTKLEFLSALRERLSGLPSEDIEKSVEYYSEMIDDRVEDGVAEEDAVEAIGSVDEAVSNILADTPLPKLVREKVKPKRSLRAWEIVLLILGSPLWLSLLLAAIIVVFSVYIVIWSVVIVLYAVVLTFGVGAIAGMTGMISFAVRGNVAQGILFLGAGLLCAGLTILSFYLSNFAAKGVALLGKNFCIGIKRSFIGKEEV